MDFAGSVALVTGGGAGIGAGISERLAAEGAHVVVADLDEETGTATAERIRGSFVRADVASADGVHAAVDAACRRPDSLGVLVNNAGGVEGRHFPAASPDEWNQTLDLNLRAVMLATQLVLGPMRERGGGAIINIASVAGLGTILAALPPVLSPRDIAAAVMELLTNDTLAGRTLVCHGGEPNHLLPLVDEP